METALKNKRLQVGNKIYSPLWIAMLPLVLTTALRYKVGTDYTFYSENQIPIILGLKKPDYWQVIDYEPGFEALVKFCATILHDETWFFPITAIIFMLLVTLYISDLSENQVLSIFILVASCYYNFSFNIIRQTLVTAIFLFSIRFIVRKEPIKYVICILIASTFHKTALVYLLVYFLVNIKISKSVRIMLIPIVSIGQLLIKGLIIYICHTFHFYEGYIDVALGESSRFPFSLTIIYIIIYLLPVLFVPDEERNTQLGKIYSIIETLSIIIVLCGSIVQESTRIIYMFFPIYIVSIPYWINRMKPDRLYKIFIFSIIILFLYLFVYYILLNDYGQTLVYQSIFIK